MGDGERLAGESTRCSRRTQYEPDAPQAYYRPQHQKDGEGGEWLGVSAVVKAILLPQKWCNRA